MSAKSWTFHVRQLMTSEELLKKRKEDAEKLLKEKARFKPCGKNPWCVVSVSC